MTTTASRDDMMTSPVDAPFFWALEPRISLLGRVVRHPCSVHKMMLLNRKTSTLMRSNRRCCILASKDAALNHIELWLLMLHNPSDDVVEQDAAAVGLLLFIVVC